jgi:ATP/ADP translocase
MTRDTKDTLIVTSCGAESIAFLKVSFINILLYHSVFVYTP